MEKMMRGQVLFVGGSGIVGRQAVRFFRQRHPDLPILIGGRDLAKARAVAREVSPAEAVKLDVESPGLGLGRDVCLAAVVMMAPDEGLHGLACAQERGIPYLSIGNWLVEVGAEMAHFIRRPRAAPIVLASHWHGGPAVFLTQLIAKTLDSVRAIRVGAIVDELDPTGPAAIADMERGGEGGTGALAFEGGRRVWLSGDAARRMVSAIDGRELEAIAFAPYDIVSLHAVTGAQDVRFDLATGVSSSRLRGGDIATELIVEIDGEIGAIPRSRRSTIEFPKGQAALTGLSIVLALSTVLGLEGRPPAPPGLYFPELLMDTEWFLDELVRAGATVEKDVE
ncbi:hypothetical protein [Halotalea alkalilenta]|uniref:hypothetical protein n=1 Tax=Halotalea alkalilenta TaxID=376489 RepID=UPI0006933CAC|nr:hypothetical protein [Halotalea alkalilenta]